MSSDLYTFDISFRKHSTPDMVSYDGSGDLLFYSDPYPSFTDVPQGNLNNSPLDTFSSSLFSLSPPSTHHQANHGVKSEECQMGVDYYTYNRHFCTGGAETESASKLMQRSYSCNSFDGKPGFSSEANRNTLMDSPNFHWHALDSPEKRFFTGQMRRVSSAGDLQKMKTTHTSQTESTLLEEANFKVGRYSAEERKERISKYRAKRSQRKFNKIIKYACRKTLADNRTRIRGRFARNDETSEIPKVPCSSTSTTEEYEDEFWVGLIDGLNGELLR